MQKPWNMVALAMVILFLLALLCSLSFLGMTGNHHCDDCDHCHICSQIQSCQACLRQGSLAISILVILGLVFWISEYNGCFLVCWGKRDTLQSLCVKLTI